MFLYFVCHTNNEEIRCGQNRGQRGISDLIS
uniref:Uncharacterized protein n=1 Tax=Anguilla anguilla TaxID=7936 RepID=A0A0E9WA61_ANGAN